MSIPLADLYRDLHAHPELSLREHRTAGIIAERMRAASLEVTTGVGGTGVVAVLANGPGATVHLRADMDGLPVLEQTGLDYASIEVAQSLDGVGAPTPVMHACGHDMHVTCLIGAMEQLVQGRAEWSGTVVALFQPAEETLEGAAAMVADGYPARFPAPDVVLGQHVAPLPAGTVAVHAGTAMAATDSIQITFSGRGGHGSRPHTTIDPIVAASAAVLRLQTIVAREVEPGTLAVVTVGSFHSGTKSNIIPATATIAVNVRSVGAESRERMLAAIERIVRAEAAASGMPDPQIVPRDGGAATVNDPAATERLRGRFVAELGEASVIDVGVSSGSEDVGALSTAAGCPLVFWFFGGADPDEYARAVAADTIDRDVPSNHSPFYAPVIEPTISNGVEHLVVAAREWLDGGRLDAGGAGAAGAAAG